MNYITKQAYVRGVAARGILRTRVMQKMAEENTQPGDSAKETPKKTYKLNGSFLDPNPGFFKGVRNSYLKNNFFANEGDYLKSGLIGLGAGGIIGALIQAARGKNLLSGALVGGGIGAGLGAGGKYLSDKYIYPKAIESAQKDTLADLMVMREHPEAIADMASSHFLPFLPRGKSYSQLTPQEQAALNLYMGAIVNGRTEYEGTDINDIHQVPQQQPVAPQPAPGSPEKPWI